MENRRSFIKMLGLLGAGVALGVKPAPAKKVKTNISAWDKQLRADVQTEDVLHSFTGLNETPDKDHRLSKQALARLERFAGQDAMIDPINIDGKPSWVLLVGKEQTKELKRLGILKEA